MPDVSVFNIPQPLGPGDSPTFAGITSNGDVDLSGGGFDVILSRDSFGRVIYGDITFADLECPLCTERFEEGDPLILLTRKTTDKTIDAYPVHLTCIGLNKPSTTGQKPGIGRYVCVCCEEDLYLDDDSDKLPPCAKCHCTKFFPGRMIK